MAPNSCLLTLFLTFYTLSTLALPTPTATESDAGGIPKSVLQSCAKGMNGKPPYPLPSNFKFSGNVRQYYIAAEEVVWDYAPTGWDNWLGIPLVDSPRAKSVSAVKYGTKWLKALYRGYTDSSFTEYSPQPPWQGIPGPTIRSEVGDLIEIMFVNKLRRNYATMHSMGLAYTKFDEGSDYPNSTSTGASETITETEAVPPELVGVEPHGCVVYKWLVDVNSGPSFGEVAVTHSYHSYVAMQQDVDAGLVGPQIVYAPGQMEHTMANYREFTLLYNIFSEADSWLSRENEFRLDPAKAHQAKPITIPYHSPGNVSIWKPELTNWEGSLKFKGAPAYFSMNGYIFGNNPVFEACANDKVIWYVNGYGAASHVFHMHGNNFVYEGVKSYAESLNDGVGKTMYMNATGIGEWQVLCHVADHNSGGMESYYEVYEPGKCPLAPLGS